MASFDRTTIVRGPCKITYDGATFYSKGGVTLTVNQSSFDKQSDAYGLIGRGKTDMSVVVEFEPVGEIESLTVLFPYGATTIGAGIYGATKAAVSFLSESLRVESRGKIKVTTVKPTGVPTTGLSATVINQAAGVGILGQNMPEFVSMVEQMGAGTFPAERLDPENIDYASLAPEHIADAILHVINQPWGVSIGEITVRGAGDHFIL